MTSNDAFPDEIDMERAADVALVKSLNDPALWHEAATAVFAYLGDPHGFLPWLIQQPGLDRATAGWLLLWPQGSRFLRGETDSFYARIPDREVVGLLTALCERGERLGFSEDRVGLDGDFEPERQACRAVVEAGETVAGVTPPLAIIGRPFAPPRSGCDYEVHDGLLLNKRLFRR